MSLTHSCLLSQMLYIGTMSHGEESRMKRFCKSKLTKRIPPGDLFRDSVRMSTDNHARSLCPLHMYTYVYILPLQLYEREWIETLEGKLIFSACLKKVPVKTKMVIASWWGTVTPGAQTKRTDQKFTWLCMCFHLLIASFILQISIGFAKIQWVTGACNWETKSKRCTPWYLVEKRSNCRFLCNSTICMWIRYCV